MPRRTPRRTPRRRSSPKRAQPEPRAYEVEFIPGLERFVGDELVRKLGRREFRPSARAGEGRMQIDYSGHVKNLLDLRSVVAVHAVERFDVPRPRALLGHQYLTRLLAAVGWVIRLHPSGTFRTMRVSAAGQGSRTMRRLRSEIAAALDLDDGTDAAHLSLSVRPSTSGAGWDALIRLTPMALSARAWRVCNRASALNATVAHSMVALAGHRAGARLVNLCCGSGTLMIERATARPSAEIVGIDIDPEALSCAERNLDAAHARNRTHLVLGDARRAPLPTASFDAAVADLPFGMASNPNGDLGSLYEETLREAARLVSPRGAFAVVTTRRRLLEDALARNAERWARRAEFPLRVSFRRGYITPSVYLLHRV